MQNWEYNFIVFKLETGMSVKEVVRLDQLNAAGAAGWEMVNVMPLGQSFLMYTFKRPRDEAARAQKQGAAAAQPRATAQKTKPRALNEISLEPKPQVQPQAQPQPEPQAGINVMDILNSILGGGGGGN